MDEAKYRVTQYQISSLLGLIDENEIAVPEIQRPFVWDGAEVRDFIDSLYKGYPTGYLITWKNPNVRLKDGRNAEGKTILINMRRRWRGSNSRSRAFTFPIFPICFAFRSCTFSAAENCAIL